MATWMRLNMRRVMLWFRGEMGRKLIVFGFHNP